MSRTESDGKHTWVKVQGVPENATCKACFILRRGHGERGLAYSYDGECWVQRRPDCPGAPIARTEPRTKHGDKILSARIRGPDGRYFTAGIAFVNEAKNYIKVQMYARPLNGEWDGVLYLHLGGNVDDSRTPDDQETG